MPFADDEDYFPVPEQSPSIAFPPPPYLGNSDQTVVGFQGISHRVTMNSLPTLPPFRTNYMTDTRDTLFSLAKDVKPELDDPINETNNIHEAIDLEGLVHLKLDTSATKNLAMITLSISDSPVNIQRPSMDLVCVIDKSGSMSGDKMIAVCATLKHIVQVSQVA